MSLGKASLKPSASYARTPHSPHRSNARRTLFARSAGGPNSASRFLSSPLATADRARKILPCHDESCDTAPLAARGEVKTRASRLTVVGRVAVVARLMAPPASSVVHHRAPWPIDSQAVEDVPELRTPREYRISVVESP